MRGSRHKRFVASACAMLWILSTTAGATQAVLCIGPEGHFALEPSGVSDCADCTPHGEKAALSGSLACIDACGDCVDIPLPGQSEEAITPGKHHIEFKPVVSLLSDAFFAEQQIAMESTRAVIASPPIHPLIRTTILLL